MSNWPKIQQLAKEVNSGKTSAASLVAKSLALIEQKKEFQAIISTTSDRARRRAEEIDNKVKKGQNAGRLAGVPFIAKDNFLAFGAETTAASNMLKGFDAPYQATAINKLEAEGAICVAKANLDAFAHGSSTENSDFFTTLNPYDKSRVPGGSSGGSAASIALDVAPFSLGTDTGGSIRAPASFCGVVGYKPTYGLVSRSGVVAMASSTDCIGALANCVEDVALVMEVMSGQDDLDSTTVEVKDNKFSDFKKPNKQIKIGLVKEYLADGINQKVKDRVLSISEKISNNGDIVKEISLPSLPLALAVYYILCPAEVASNLSRYDGQRYGFSDANSKSLEESYYNSRSKGFGNEAKRRIMIGTYVLSSGYYDAYYKKAQIVRTKMINEFTEAFKKVDYLIGPATPTTAFKIGEFTADPLSMYLNDIVLVAANLVGIPSIAIPAGKVDKLPIGVQLMARQKEDHNLINYAKYLEELINA
jgi:aspartyl-tRNA(Asn)/glutamyl-tRNA(Gln) amidotransferase subunit A